MSDILKIHLHECEAHIDGMEIHIRPKDRLLSEVASKQNSPSPSDKSPDESDSNLHGDDSPGQMLNEAQEKEQERMAQIVPPNQSSLFPDLSDITSTQMADITENILDAAIADSTVPLYTAASTPALATRAQTSINTNVITTTPTPITTSSPTSTLIFAPDDAPTTPTTLPDTANTITTDTRLTTTEVTYTQNKINNEIKFTFTTPTTTFAPRTDFTQIQQIADMYEHQNHIQRNMLERRALDKLLEENDHRMWNAITYAKSKLEHARQIHTIQNVPAPQSPPIQQTIPTTQQTKVSSPSLPSTTVVTSTGTLVSSPHPSTSWTVDGAGTCITPMPIINPVVQLARVNMTNSVVNLEPSHKTFVTKPIPVSKLTASRRKAAPVESPSSDSTIIEETSPSFTSEEDNDSEWTPVKPSGNSGRKSTKRFKTK